MIFYDFCTFYFIKTYQRGLYLPCIIITMNISASHFFKWHTKIRIEITFLLSRVPAHVGEISLEWVCAGKRFMKHKKVVFMGIVYLEYKLSNTRSITACDAVILGAQICICYYILNLHNLKMSSMNCICTFPQLNTFNFFGA